MPWLLPYLQMNCQTSPQSLRVAAANCAPCQHTSPHRRGFGVNGRVRCAAASGHVVGRVIVNVHFLLVVVELTGTWCPGELFPIGGRLIGLGDELMCLLQGVEHLNAFQDGLLRGVVDWDRSSSRCFSPFCVSYKTSPQGCGVRTYDFLPSQQAASASFSGAKGAKVGSMSQLEGNLDSPLSPFSTYRVPVQASKGFAGPGVYTLSGNIANTSWLVHIVDANPFAALLSPPRGVCEGEQRAKDPVSPQGCCPRRVACPRAVQVHLVLPSPPRGVRDVGQHAKPLVSPPGCPTR
eukprot:2937250-Amphidinium_carterae.1